MGVNAAARAKKRAYNLRLANSRSKVDRESTYNEKCQLPPMSATQERSSDASTVEKQFEAPLINSPWTKETGSPQTRKCRKNLITTSKKRSPKRVKMQSRSRPSDTGVINPFGDNQCAIAEIAVKIKTLKLTNSQAPTVSIRSLPRPPRKKSPPIQKKKRKDIPGKIQNHQLNLSCGLNLGLYDRELNSRSPGDHMISVVTVSTVSAVKDHAWPASSSSCSLRSLSMTTQGRILSSTLTLEGI